MIPAQASAEEPDRGWAAGGCRASTYRSGRIGEARDRAGEVEDRTLPAMPAPDRSARGPTLAALSAVLLLALGLRFAGVDRELPHNVEPDAYVAYLLQSLRGDPALVREVNFRERYPSLLARAFALLPYPEIPARPAHSTGTDAERTHLEA